MFLLDGYLSGHFWMDRAKVGEGSRFVESEGKGLVSIEHTGFENAFGADDGMRNIVAIRPGNPCARRNRDGLRAETEIVYFDFYNFGRRLRVCRVRSASSCDQETS